MQMNNDGIDMDSKNFFDDMIYVDHVLQMMWICMDNKCNKKFLVVSTVVR
jgi:hypothetical protein